MAQTTAAAVLAWVVAERLLPESRPAFAPLTAIIALGATLGERGRRAVRVTAGVAVGLGVANVVLHLIGPGAWQLGAVTAAALLVAVVLSTDATLVVQAGVSGALAVAVSGAETIVPYRFSESLVGGAAALLFSQVLFPADAAAGVRAATRHVLRLVGQALAIGAAGLADGDDDALARAHAALRSAAAGLAEVDAAVQRATRDVRITRPTPGRRTAVDRHHQVPALMEAIVSDCSVLLRARSELRTPAEVPRLATVLGALGDVATSVASNRDGGRAEAAARTAAELGARARRMMEGRQPAPAAAVPLALVASTADRLQDLARRL